MTDRTKTAVGRPSVVVERRDTLKALLCIGCCLPAAKYARAEDVAANVPPQENDRLVFAFGDRGGEIIAADDLRTDEPQVFAYPIDSLTGVIRNGTRLNQLLLTRIDPARASERTLSRSAASVVAYSAVCTHTGCDVTDWNGEARRFQCPCHDSQFDPADGARVVGGPAPRPLPALPLKIEDRVLTVAGRFDSPVGFQQPGLDPFGF